MAPKSDDSNDVQVIHSSGDNESELPFKDRMVIRVVKQWQSTRIWVYNKEYQTIFGNTSSFWIKTSIYYFFFYICLGLFYSGMVAVFAAILSRESPRYLFHNSQMSIKGNVYPGVGFRPMPDMTSTSVTLYNDTASINNTVATLRGYVAVFLTQYDTTYLSDCSPTAPASQLQAGFSCKLSWTDVVTTDTHPCSDTNLYGWGTGMPCMLIKLNKIYGWLPQTGSIAIQVANFTGQPVSPIDQREQNIYITCNGKEASDKAALGPMIYYSLLSPLGNSNYGGLPYYFFPYMNAKDSVEPFVLVQFTSLPLEQKITIQCRAWAPNIEQFSQGSTMRGIAEFDITKTNKLGPQST
ncbi:unnamed protein product [Adineta steineri]|uniref:Uncharacterized protein n=1 Tax=Adineta steineri TaxID=433720 RepID=A0A815ZAA1_9BILA|nr:unnamed protein product [Adineta steineri]